MDRNSADLTDRPKSAAAVNGSMRRPIPGALPGTPGTPRPPAHLVDVGGPAVGSPGGPGAYNRVVVHRDDRGYGMKVSGDNPVYVQSVKEGGAAEKAGLHSGDKIIKVNGVDVMESKHTEVVALIKSSNQVVLTVQQRPYHRTMNSPSLHNRPAHVASSSRITGPKPADFEKQELFRKEQEQTIHLMLEKEQRYAEALRSELARNPGDEKKLANLTNAERNVEQLHRKLQELASGQNELTPPINCPYHIPDPTNKSNCAKYPSAMTLPAKSRVRPKIPHSTSFPSCAEHLESPPPIPKRNKQSRDGSPTDPELRDRRTAVLRNVGCKFGSQTKLNQEASGRPAGLHKSNSNPTKGIMVENTLYRNSPVDPSPPPLPPRNPPTSPGSCDPDAVNSISKQMSYPLVATCATLVNHYPCTNHTQHHRTKSSPDPLTAAAATTPADARRLAVSESLTDLRPAEPWATPPGTPPPPYPSPLAGRKAGAVSNRSSVGTEDGDGGSFFCEDNVEGSPDVSPLRAVGASPGCMIATSSPITAATPNVIQQPIISMEDDEISDQEFGQIEDHGPFKSISRLWEHPTHLAVFMNYVLSNSDPSSLLFYLLTDLYKEGTAKDMRKWAYEIHSSFLVPGAPLRLNNVDENIAREIDEVLLKEWDKEEILRKIFWKARNRAKEELNEQLADFQQKRTAGLGTIFGPADAKLLEISHDKAKEIKLFETLLLDKLDPYLDEFEKESAEPRRYITAAALATVITKIFGVRGTHSSHSALERCPTFISKDKSFRSKFMGRYTRKENFNGHHYSALHYYTVISCNNCHQIIYGIGPQGYQCSLCLINLHRHCVKLYEDTCPGPITKKDRGIGKFMDKIRSDSKESRRKPNPYLINLEREKKLAEEKDSVPENEQTIGDRQTGQPVSRSSSDKRPDALTEEISSAKTQDHENDTEPTDNARDNLHNVPRARSSQPAINRSESYKEQSQKRRQIRERRKISDPNLSKSNDVDSDHQQELSYHSGSSSNSSLSSSRSSESPQSTSLDTVASTAVGGAGGGTPGTHTAAAGYESDLDIEPDPPDWQSMVPEEVLSRLHPEEKNRQQVINELFHTEKSHLRNLLVLETVFYRPLLNSKYLPPEQVNLLFPNLEEMLDIHGAFNASMKARRKEENVIGDIGELLLSMFDGPAGENFQRAAATFCARQQLALESLKERRKKDQRLHSFLLECESDKLCKRLQLKDIIPTGMQRLVKYPLLFESLKKYTERLLESTMTESPLPSTSPTTTPSPAPTAPHMGPTPQELPRLRRALERSREILNNVNQAVKEAEDCARLQEIQRKLDKSSFDKADNHISVEYKNMDLTRHKLIYEGPLQWRINKQKLSMHVVLLEEILVLLQKQDDRFVLKFYTSTGVERSPIHSPIVKVSTVLVRPNAAAKDSLFLVNTSHNGAQIYDLVAPTPNDCKTWFKHISDAADAYKSREGKSRRPELLTPDSECTPEPPAAAAAPPEAPTATAGEPSDKPEEPAEPEAEVVENGSNRSSQALEDEAEKRLSQGSDSGGVPDGNGTVVGNSKREAHMRLATEEQPLIQPSEVTVNILPVHTAQPVITPIEQVRRKDEAIRQALAEKQALVAEILQVPPEEFQTIADMAGDMSSEKEPTELVLAAVNQASQLWSAVSDSLNVTETDQVTSGSSQVPALCSSHEAKPNVTMLPNSHRIQDIASTLNTQLTALLKVVKEREDERERMRRELQKLREQIHVMHEAQLRASGVEAEPENDASSAELLENIEEDP